MLGIKKRIIVSNTHLLVVERPYFILGFNPKIKRRTTATFAKISFASNTLNLFISYLWNLPNILPIFLNIGGLTDINP